MVLFLFPFLLLVLTPGFSRSPFRFFGFISFYDFFFLLETTEIIAWTWAASKVANLQQLTNETMNISLF